MFPTNPEGLTGYHYMPAAHDVKIPRGATLFIKYGPTGEVGIRKHCSTGFHHIFAPDREIVVVDRKSWSNIPDKSWDEIIGIDPLYPSSADFNINYVMNNSIQDKHDMQDEALWSVRRSPTVRVMDSGGFQVITGAVESIHPKLLAQTYIDHTDVGISLDIPIGKHGHLLDMSAKVQKGNNDIILGELDGTGVELMNVVHGGLLPSIYKFHDKIFDTRSKRLALALHIRISPVDSAYRLLSLIEHTKGQYYHYHVLGTFIPAFAAILCRLLSRLYPQALVTSDSSGATMFMTTKKFVRYSSETGLSVTDELRYGSSYANKGFAGVGSRLSCSCPVCSRLKYVDALNPAGRLGAALLYKHNVLAYIQAADHISEMAKTLDDHDFKQFMTHLLGNKRRDEISGYMNFIKYAEDHGIVAAGRKYQHMMAHSSIYDKFGHMDLFMDVEDRGAYTAQESHLKAVADNMTRNINAIKSGGKGDEASHGKARKKQFTRTSMKKPKQEVPANA